MPKASKFSPDEGITIYDLKDSEAVHYGDQSKGYVGKNLMPNFGKSTQSQYGWTVTKNSDNSLSIVANNVTQNSGYGITQHDMVGENYYLPAGTYIISGGNDDMTGAVNLTFQFNGGANHNLNASNKEETITLTETSLVDCRLWFYANKSITTTIYPMIRLASIPDSTYEPYLTPNTEIDNKVSWADNGILGAKNLLNTFLPSFTDHGVTFTVNNDGSITANGTANGDNAEFHFINGTNHTYNKYSQFAGKTCIISGCPSGGSSSTYYISLWDNIVGQNVNDYGNGVVYTFPNSEPTAHNIKIRILNGIHVDNITFYPMIRLASDTDNTYFPYAMTNRELTEVQKITFLNDTTNSRFIKGYKVGRIVNICIKGSFPQNDTYPTLDTPIPDSWYPYESIAASNYSAGQNTGTAFAMIDVDSKKIRISNVANVSYYNTTLSYISKG